MTNIEKNNDLETLGNSDDEGKLLPNQNYLKLFYSDKYGLLFTSYFSLFNKSMDFHLGKKVIIEQKNGQVHIHLKQGSIVLKNNKIIALYEK